ncbi:dihydropteroate synthase [Photobacterium atrarenae]|uniref:dihydropteroate synthase n=1 Tax=Photobacterium atrarenae TaxID=865757 RepID=A0ABY5GQR8_9GAMM|nr:dihydropteroate synthase [Photobacterium atrarenae]UTV30999.1 dihydropteroate synthase [Photobacterium atrarenae]
MMLLHAKERTLDLSTPQVMGILNITPDSFSDGHRDEPVMFRVEQMVQQGAAIIDVGGESTRPGWTPISEQAEMDRICPVIERIAHSFDVMISVDTYKAAVMKAACDAGAHLLNDINGFRNTDAIDCAVDTGAALCVMHMDGDITHMHNAVAERDILQNVSRFFRQKVDELIAAGIDGNRILLDPGFGFGKTHQQNMHLLKHLCRIEYGMDYPLLVGLSRKRMVGEMIGKAVHDRTTGSVAAAMYSVLNGAKVVRVHDVGETVDALNVIRHLAQA